MPIYFIAFVSHIALLYFSVKITNKHVSFLLAVISVLPFAWWRGCVMHLSVPIPRHIPSGVFMPRSIIRSQVLWVLAQIESRYS